VLGHTDHGIGGSVLSHFEWVCIVVGAWYLAQKYFVCMIYAGGEDLRVELKLKMVL
jgi:hypothetical protein